MNPQSTNADAKNLNALNFTVTVSQMAPIVQTATARHVKMFQNTKTNVNSQSNQPI